MTEQVLDVRRALRIVRRAWTTVAILALVGALLGIGFEVARGSGFRATALVLLPASQVSAATTAASTKSANDITTDGKVATSAAVLVPAGRRADPSLTLADLQSRVTTAAAASGVLEITASGPTAHQAEALANAVATELVTYVTSSGSSTDAAQVSALQAQAAQLNRQINDVQQELAAAKQRVATKGATSPTGQRASGLVAQLTSEQTTLNLELDSVNSQISQAKLGAVSANQGTKVIQRATTAVGPSIAGRLVDPLLGALCGAVVGCVYVLARERRDPRLRTRDDLSWALGSPVLLSLESPGPRSISEWSALLERYQPTAVEQWNVRRALRELGVGDAGGSTLVTLTLAGDTGSLAQAVRVALAGVESGLRTLLTVVTGDGPSSGLETACARFAADGRGPREGLEVRTGVPGNLSELADLAVVVVVLDPADPIVPAARRRDVTTVVSVSAGFASADDLARVAIAVADSGEGVKGVFVANPDPGDQTVGRVAGSVAPTSLEFRRRGPDPRQVASSARTR